MGYTTVDLRAVSEMDLRRALIEAHARSLEPPPKRRPKTAAQKKRKKR
jgi:hypothetical protein